MKHHNPQSGFSLIDMIMGMSIISIALVGIMSVQNNYINMSTKLEVGFRAIALGNSVMSTIRMHRFDENASAPWSATLGTDTGETSSDDYDDIDDYASAAWDFSYWYPGYTVNSRVFSINLATSWVDSVGAPNNFKRIIVSINHEALDSPIVFSSLMAGIIVDG